MFQPKAVKSGHRHQSKNEKIFPRAPQQHISERVVVDELSANLATELYELKQKAINSEKLATALKEKADKAQKLHEQLHRQLRIDNGAEEQLRSELKQLKTR